MSNDLKKDPKKLTWVRKNNEFLLNLIDDTTYMYLYNLDNSDCAMLENPGITFQRRAKAAHEHLKKYENSSEPLPPHPDPYVQEMIDVTDKEYDDMLAEAKRQSDFWRGSPTCSVMALIARTLLDGQASVPKAAKASDAADISELEHNKSADVNRHKNLPALTRQVHKMREYLLNTVLGQDHAVHAFAEGIFNARVLAAADEKRRRPLAVFTFAGPPGVGKTFLAEQAAEYIGLPCHRFDMSEYASSCDQEGLIGIDYFYKNAAPGKLTAYVRKNPKCVLIFDEIEKAHQNTLQLFYQILDSGVLTDKFIETRRNAAIDGAIKSEEKQMEDKYKEEDPHISFKDTIIIFTTNVGRALYEGDKYVSAAAVPRSSIINALTAEINPLTGAPFFPAALVSRMATGYPLMFSCLKPHDFVKIAENEYKRCADMISSEYGITVTVDDCTILSLLFAQGGRSDARSLRARTELFFKNELFKLLSIDPEFLSDVDEIEFKAETDSLPEDVKRLFYAEESIDILLYTNRLLAKRIVKALDGCGVHFVRNNAEALAAAAENDIRLALIDISQQSSDGDTDEDGGDDVKTAPASMAASVWRDGKRLFSELTEKFPDIPVYLLRTAGSDIDKELLTSFIRAGARGMLDEPAKGNPEKFREQIAEIAVQLHMQAAAADIAAAHKALGFETAPKLYGGKTVISLRNFALKRAAEAEDMNDLLGEADKPKERFSDVIGAVSAKKELMFFADFLKNTKKYIAQGYRFPKGILLYGRPGTGKTMLAKALAGEADVAFIPALASSFVNVYAGTGPAAVRKLFKQALRYAPAVIFIDEIDTIAKPRGIGNHAQEDTLNALLAEMDGFAVDPKRPVFVLAATNYDAGGGSDGIGKLDEAFMRRFDRKILIELPNTEEREQYISLMLSKVKEHSVTEETVKSIASRSLGMSLAILSNVIEAAKRMAFEKNVPLDGDMLTEAFETARFGEKKDWSRELIMRTARHEAGHTVVNMLCGGKPAYLTIEARGDFGGYMEHSEEEINKKLNSKTEILNRIRTCLGGRAAEIVYYGETEGLSTGASSDLRNATDCAFDMIVRYGMDESVGLASISRDRAAASPEITSRVNEILSEELTAALEIINGSRDKVDALVDALLEKNRLTGEEIERIIGQK